jgi:outer membrane receptor for ferrienterochelin and colicins
LPAAAALVALLATPAASAQTLDYAGFEGLFDEPVTSSATGKPERVSDTPATMDVITAEDIRRSGARDLASLLRALPGIINYRGFNGTESFSMGALLLNGREIYTASFNQNLLEALPVELDEIRQIEVVRGPQSALYGFNAGDGVINIITFDPGQDDLGVALGRVGNHGRRDGAVIATLPLGAGSGLRLSIGGDHAHDAGDVLLPGKQPPPQNTDRQSLAANLSLLLPNGDHAGAELSHVDFSTRMQVPEAIGFLDLRLQTDAVKADYAADTAIGTVGAMVAFSSQTVPQAASPVNPQFLLHDRTIDAKADDLIKASPDDSLRFEVEVRHEAVHTGNSIAPIDAILAGGSAMWEHEFGSGLSVVNVVRYASNQTTQGDSSQPAAYVTFANHGLSDNSDLIWKATAADSLRLSFSRGLALPSQLTFEQLNSAAALGKKSSLANDPDVATANITEYRLTWDHSFAEPAALARVSLFDKQSSDTVGLAPLQLEASFLPTCLRPTARTAPVCVLMARETGVPGVMQGAQAQLDHKSRDGLVWGLNYSFERVHAHPTADAASQVPALLATRDFHKFNANLGYGWNDWTADLRLFYSSPVRSLVMSTAPAPQATEVSGKDVVSASPHLSWMPRSDLSVDLAADNLWGYKADLLQRMPTTYFLTIRYLY